MEKEHNGSKAILYYGDRSVEMRALTPTGNWKRNLFEEKFLEYRERERERGSLFENTSQKQEIYAEGRLFHNNQIIINKHPCASNILQPFPQKPACPLDSARKREGKIR